MIRLMLELGFKWWAIPIILAIFYIEVFSFDLIQIPIPQWLECEEFRRWKRMTDYLAIQRRLAASVYEDVQ